MQPNCACLYPSLALEERQEGKLTISSYVGERSGDVVGAVSTALPLIHRLAIKLSALALCVTKRQSWRGGCTNALGFAQSEAGPGSACARACGGQPRRWRATQSLPTTPARLPARRRITRHRSRQRHIPPSESRSVGLLRFGLILYTLRRLRVPRRQTRLPERVETRAAAAGEEHDRQQPPHRTHATSGTRLNHRPDCNRDDATPDIPHTGPYGYERQGCSYRGRPQPRPA